MSEIEIVDPVEDPRWERLVTGQPSDVFHSPSWLRVLRDTYGFGLNAALIGGDAPRAGMVYTSIEDHMDPRIVSIPFSDFCDPLVSDSAEWDAIMDRLDADHQRVHLRCLRNPIPAQDGRFEEVGRYYWHGVDTSRDPDTIWSTIDPSARRAIRKAMAAGVEIRAAESLADLREFYELHLRVRKYKYGLLAQPFAFFEQIWRNFVERDAGMLLLASHEGRVLSGVMFLQWKDTLYYKFNASDLSELSIRPNDLVVWTGIGQAHERGLAKLDFGVSDMDQEGLVRYKRKYASSESQVVALRRLPGGTASRREAVARRMLGDLTGVLAAQDVPDEVTERGGDVLYRYFT